jgi:hypothetical protein
MRRILFFAGVLVLGASATIPAQWLNHKIPGVPRSPDGKPKLDAPAQRTADGRPDLFRCVDARGDNGRRGQTSVWPDGRRPDQGGRAGHGDPKMYTRPFTVRIPHNLMADDDIFEMFPQNEKDCVRIAKK